MQNQNVIINYSIKDTKWKNFRHGTELEIQTLEFSPAGLEIISYDNSYLTHYITSKKSNINVNVHSKTKSKDVTVGHPLAGQPDILQFDKPFCSYLLDEKSNYFAKGALCFDAGFVKFCKKRDEFLANPNNGVVVLPAHIVDVFIRDVMDEAKAQSKSKPRFADYLARVAKFRAGFWKIHALPLQK